jgi:murein DD-endopeptidase MepM/ murein hydrolase activator NlpD
MDIHANRPRREFLRSGFAALGVAAAAGVSGVALALGIGRSEVAGSADPVRRVAVGDPSALRRLDGPATVAAHADRLGVPPPVVRDPGGGRLVFPVDPTARSSVIDNFGDCRSGGQRAHIGTDIASERGAAIYAVADGRLTNQWLNTGTAGFGWELTADDGRRFRYFHLDRFFPGRRLGDRVVFGEVIGWVGSSGNFIWVNGQPVEDRTNIHLHFEVHPSGSAAIDPLGLMAVPDHIRIGPSLDSCSHLL